MAKLAMAIKEYGSGKVLFFTDTFSGFFTKTPKPLWTWFNIFYFLTKKKSINISYISDSEFDDVSVLAKIPNITLEKIEPQIPYIYGLNSDILIINGVKTDYSQEFVELVNEYVFGGGVLVICNPNKIGVTTLLTSIGGVNITEQYEYNQINTYWTNLGKSYSFYNEFFKIGLMASVDFDVTWTPIMSTVEEITVENIPQAGVTTVSSDFIISYNSGINKGIIKVS
jgi:hypothetical protein